MQRVQRLQIVQTHGSDIEARLLMTPSSVARSLNRQGVKGKPGGKWQGNAITRTIENTFHEKRRNSHTLPIGVQSHGMLFNHIRNSRNAHQDV